MKTYKLKRLKLLLAGVLFSCLAFAQENYQPGFVIKNNGDTIKGFIDYRNWSVNPKKIDFKSTLNSGSVAYIPTDIKEFHVKDEIYASGIVEVENTTIRERELDYDANLKITTDTVFLQTLLKAEKGLYYYRNADGRDNFYFTKSGVFELLLYKKIKERNEKEYTDYIRENKTYMNQLIEYFSDCEAIRPKIENATYNQSDLIKLFKDYYKCSSSVIGFQRKAEKIHLEIGALAGLSLTTLKFSSSSSDFDFLESTDFKASSNYSAALFFDMIMPRNQGKLSINNELLYSFYETNGQYENTDYNNTYKKFTTEFSYSYLKINTLLRFKFPVGKVFLFFNGGISNGFLLNGTNHIYKEITTTYTGTSFYDGTVFTQVKDYEQGFLIGTGIKFKKFSLETRFEKGDGMINVPAVSSSVTRYYFILGYRFK